MEIYSRLSITLVITNASPGQARWDLKSCSQNQDFCGLSIKNKKRQIVNQVQV